MSTNPFFQMTLAEVENLKDKAHERLLFLCEEDPLTGCWVYTGPWQAKSGLGVMRVANHQWTAHRIAAWVYLGGFNLEDLAVQVKHSCKACPACINPEHLLLKRTAAVGICSVAA